MTFGTGATPYSCRIFPTRGRIPMCPASWVQTPSTALPASSCNTSGRQRHRKADGSMWSCREMASMRSASSDGTRTRPSAGAAGILAVAAGWQRVHHPQVAGAAAGGGTTQRYAWCLKKNPLVRIDLTRGLMYVALYEQECFSRKLNDMKLNTPFNIFCHRFKM